MALHSDREKTIKQKRNENRHVAKPSLISRKIESEIRPLSSSEQTNALLYFSAHKSLGGKLVGEALLEYKIESLPIIAIRWRLRCAVFSYTCGSNAEWKLPATKWIIKNEKWKKIQRSKMLEKNVYLAGMRYERHRTLIENANACRPINGTKNLSSGENGKKAIETKKSTWKWYDKWHKKVVVNN